MNISRKSYFHLVPILIIITLLFITYKLRKSAIPPQLSFTKQESALNLNHNFLSIFHLGNKRLYSGLLWIQTLLESDLEQYNKKDLNSWMFLRFQSIIAVDPEFYHAYLFGGLYLSVIKDDKIGAKQIYTEGLKFFPKDFALNYYSGLHHFFELRNFTQAAKLLSTVMYSPEALKHAPFLSFLVARIKAGKGDLKLAYKLLLTAYQRHKEDNPIRKKLHHDLYAIKAQIDLTCLNNQEINCDKKDFENNAYIRTSYGKYIATKGWTPFKMKFPSKQENSDL